MIFGREMALEKMCFLTFQLLIACLDYFSEADSQISSKIE
jgi:hypothetical protein